MQDILTFDSLLDEFISNTAVTMQVSGELNVIEFAEDILFNGNTQLFPQQKALLKAFYNQPLEDIEREILEEWSSNERTTWVENRSYSNLICEAGRGGTKSTIASIIALYEFFNLISLENPSKYYNLLANDPIAIFVIATTQAQVKETLYAKIKGFAEQSDYFKTLTNNKHILIQAESIKCPSKNVAIYAKHTNSPALVGYTLKALILDEVARFETRIEPDGSITSTADELWDNIGAAVKRFGKEGKRIAISSAWAVNDSIYRFYELSKADKQSLGFRLRTWDLNKRKESSREACNSDYIKDKASAELEYEGIRKEGEGHFISQEHLNKCTVGRSIIDTSEKDLDIKVNNDIRYYVGVDIDRIDKYNGDNSTAYFIHVDFSIKRDATGLCISHPIVEDNLWYIYVDGLIKWTPYRDSVGIKRVVHYPNIEEILKQIASNRPIKKITFDSFNSADTIQRLHLLGLTTEEASASRQSQLGYYTLTRDLLEQGLIIIPKDSVYTSQLHSELTNLIVTQTGSIKHGVNGKDLSDAFVNSIYQSYNYLISQNIVKDNKSSFVHTNPSPNALVNNSRYLKQSQSRRVIQSGLDSRVNRAISLKKRGII